MTLSNSMRCAVAAVVMGAGLVGCGPEEMAEDVAPEAAPVAEAVPEEKTGTVEAQAICDTCPEVEPGGTGGVNTTPRIEWYEGTYEGTTSSLQSLLGSTNIGTSPRRYDLSWGGESISNDEIRSAKLKYVQAGTRIVVCDCPNESNDWYYTTPCYGKDDQTSIKVNAFVGAEYIIGSFEFSSYGSPVEMYYSPPPYNSYMDKDLNGKISVIKIYPPFSDLTNLSDCGKL